MSLCDVILLIWWCDWLMHRLTELCIYSDDSCDCNPKRISTWVMCVCNYMSLFESVYCMWCDVILTVWDHCDCDMCTLWISTYICNWQMKQAVSNVVFVCVCVCVCVIVIVCNVVWDVCPIVFFFVTTFSCICHVISFRITCTRFDDSDFTSEIDAFRSLMLLSEI